MHAYQTEFIELARRHGALTFGEFTLKSGRVSPYFFDAGAFGSGAALAALGRCYANCIVDSGVRYDMLLGPAYKGIPLAAAAAIALSNHHDTDVQFAYNRKEAKDHGEGGSLVGAPLTGRVLVVDDVITAGTAAREVIELISAAGAELAGVVIGLDRQERGNRGLSAVQEVEQDFGAPVFGIVRMDLIIDHLQTSAGDDPALLEAMRSYRRRYGI